MTDIYELIAHRQSDRQYDPNHPVEPEKVARIVEAARLAPSACNAQPWHFIVVDEPELRNQVADAVASRLLGMNHFTKQAPVHILVVEERPNFTAGIGGLIKDKQFPLLDIGIAAAPHHPGRHGRGAGQLHTRLVRRESRAPSAPYPRQETGAARHRTGLLYPTPARKETQTDQRGDFLQQILIPGKKKNAAEQDSPPARRLDFI